MKDGWYCIDISDTIHILIKNFQKERNYSIAQGNAYFSVGEKITIPDYGQNLISINATRKSNILGGVNIYPDVTLTSFTLNAYSFSQAVETDEIGIMAILSTLTVS